LLHYLLTRYDPAGVLCENLQDKIFLRAKDKPLAVECPGAGGEVEVVYLIDFTDRGSLDISSDLR